MQIKYQVDILGENIRRLYVLYFNKIAVFYDKIRNLLYI